MMKKRFTKILLGIVLLAVIMLGCVCTAYADDKTISGLGTNGIANPTNGNGGWSQVYFGSQDTTPILFNVLKNGETNFTSSTNPTLLLDCASILEEMAFDGEEPYSNVWNGSPIQTYLNGEFKTNHFTTQEISAISPSSKQNKGNGDGNGWKQETRGLGWASLAGEQIFLLDAVEATNTSYGFPNITTGSATRVKVQKNYNDGQFVSDRDWRWWLRSPEMSRDNSGIMGEGGGFIFQKVNGYYGVSPALNVNLASVIFSSEISSKTYKLTIADTANRTVGIQEGNAVSRDSVTRITVPYTKDSGSNHVSLLITNAKNESNQDITWKSSSGWSNGAVKQYYTTAAVNGTTGTVTFTLPAGYETNKENWKVWLLAEQENEGNKTDYASTPLEIEPPACSEAATWSGLYDAFQTGGYIKLTGDVTCGTGGGTHASDAPLTVPTGKAVTLDLNGHVIDRGMSNAQSADNNNNVINVEGKMTLIDSKSTATHSDTQLPAGGVITGGKGMDHGGGVYVDGGTFTMNGGTIFGNSARTGGGVYIYSGAFTMNGGAIRGNSASTYNGGGVYAYGGTFTMSGGLITGNSTAQQGGGVYISKGGTTFNVSGSPQITGNFKGTQNNNVYVSGSDTAIITVGVLTPYSASEGTGSHIGVSMTHGYNAVAFTTGASFANDAAAQQYFFADNNSAYEIKASDGQAKLSPYPATAPTINTQPAATTTLTSGYTSGGTLTVSASAATDTTYEALAYQWYSNTTASSTGGTKISDATSSSFDISTGLTTGNHYYYCVVAATRSDNGQSAAATSNVAMVTVEEKDNTITSVPAMVPGTESVLKETANTDNAQTVWYADKTWRVIGYDGNGAASEGGAATLLSAGNLDQTKFDETSAYNNVYANSTLRKKIEGYEDGGSHVVGILDSFSSAEQAAIKTRPLVHGTYNGINTDCIAGGEDLTDVALWPLSTKEANAVNESLRIVDPEHTDSATNYWWLRSPGDDGRYTAFVYGDTGYVYISGFTVSDTYGVRPAFYLNLGSVLFTSVAAGGKSAALGNLTAIGENTTGEWKLTLKDDRSENAVGDGHAGFNVDTTHIIFNSKEKTAVIPYSGAAAGTNDYISAIITDAQDGNIKYYGRIAKASGETGATATVSLANVGAGDHLYIFNEQCNGDKKTDYASALTEVTIPKLISYTVTFKVKNGSWNDGTSTDKKVTLSRYDNEDKALVLQPGDIPEVGNKPANGYKTGSWDVTPSTDTTFTKDTEYTYTYKKKNNPTPPPTPSQKVAKLINNLPDPDKLTLADTDAVMEAMDAYNKLSDAQKKQVDQKLVDKLFEAYDTIQALIVDGQIKMLPDPITISDEAIVNDTIEDYLALTDHQKALVDPVLLQRLAAADDMIATAKAQAKETKVSGAKNLKGKKAQVKWKTTPDASGYQIKYSTDKKFKKGVKSKKAGKTVTNATLKHLKKGKTYYVKVRPYSEIKNRITGAEKIVYGQADGMERVKIKK